MRAGFTRGRAVGALCLTLVVLDGGCLPASSCEVVCDFTRDMNRGGNAFSLALGALARLR